MIGCGHGEPALRMTETRRRALFRPPDSANAAVNKIRVPGILPRPCLRRTSLCNGMSGGRGEDAGGEINFVEKMTNRTFTT